MKYLSDRHKKQMAYIGENIQGQYRYLVDT